MTHHTKKDMIWKNSVESKKILYKDLKKGKIDNWTHEKKKNSYCEP